MLAMASSAFCQDIEKKDTEKKKEPVIRFHSGTILAAELLPECPAEGLDVHEPAVGTHLLHFVIAGREESSRLLKAFVQEY